MRSRRKKTMFVVALIVFAMLIEFAVLYFVFYQVVIDASRNMDRERITNEIISENSVDAYVVIEDVKAGEVINETNAVVKRMLIGNKTSLFDVSDLGKQTLVDLPKDTVLYKTYMNDVGTGGGNPWLTEYSCIGLSSNMRPMDYIDVRIRYQNGEDYVVLSKKFVEDISYAASTCFLFVDEMETHLMASAIYDTIEYDAVIYAVKYVQPTIRPATVVDYIPTLATARRIWGDNINSDEAGVEPGVKYNYVYRKDLERRICLVTGAGNVSNVTVSVQTDISNGNGKGNDATSGYDTNGLERVNE